MNSNTDGSTVFVYVDAGHLVLPCSGAPLVMINKVSNVADCTPSAGYGSLPGQSIHQLSATPVEVYYVRDGLVFPGVGDDCRSVFSQDGYIVACRI